MLVVEHRDGSGPAVVLPPEGEGKESRVLYYTGVDDIRLVTPSVGMRWR